MNLPPSGLEHSVHAIAAAFLVCASIFSSAQSLFCERGSFRSFFHLLLLSAGLSLAIPPPMAGTIIRARRLGKNYHLGVLPSSPGISYAMDDFLRVTIRFRRHAGQELFGVLRVVFADVREGEVLGLIGRNDAGETTLLRNLSRITQPTIGFANIYGRLVALLEVATGFHSEQSGRGNAFLYRANLGITENFEEIVPFGELEKFTDTAVILLPHERVPESEGSVSSSRCSSKAGAIFRWSLARMQAITATDHVEDVQTLNVMEVDDGEHRIVHPSVHLSRLQQDISVVCFA